LTFRRFAWEEKKGEKGDPSLVDPLEGKKKRGNRGDYGRDQFAGCLRKKFWGFEERGGPPLHMIELESVPREEKKRGKRQPGVAAIFARGKVPRGARAPLASVGRRGKKEKKRGRTGFDHSFGPGGEP